MTSQKHGVSALGVQRSLGLGSYQTAWAMLHRYRAAMVRLLNSISEKTKKYRRSYQNLSHVTGKPFVLALTPFDQPFFYLQVQRAIEAVLYGYYVDEQEYIDDPSPTMPITGRLGAPRRRPIVPARPKPRPPLAAA